MTDKAQRLAAELARLGVPRWFDADRCAHRLERSRNRVFTDADLLTAIEIRRKP